MKTLLLLLQILTGFASLGLLILTVIKALKGHPSRVFARWTLGFAAAFAVLTMLVYGT